MLRDESVWVDFSPRHKDVREKLEEFIKRYKEGVPHLSESGEWRMPVLVAPYGSGKSTLMRYLVRYCWRNLRIPALKVNLSELVSYLKRKGFRKIHADELPKVVEEFFSSKLSELEEVIKVGGVLLRESLGLPYGRSFEEYLLPKEEFLGIVKQFKQLNNAVGVLFIDEVEEAHKNLDDYISYETTPFRGLADSIVHHTSRVFIVLALGPTTALREITFGPGGWRVERIEIPIVGRDYVQDLLSKRMEISRDVLELLANTTWWMAKGRVGWLYKVAEVLPIIADVLDDPQRLEQEVMRPNTVLDEEIIEGVRLMDKVYLQRLLSRNEKYRQLILLSSILVGPIPMSLLKELGLEKVDEFRLPEVLATGRKLVKVEELKWAFEEALKGVLSEMDLSNAMWIIGEVLKAWSCRGLLIYESECLKELRDIASDYAYDLFPLIGREISRIRVETLVVRPIQEKDELYIAIRPSHILNIYPPLVLQPLIGFAKAVTSEELYSRLAWFNWDDIRKVSEHILFEVLDFRRWIQGREEEIPLLLIVSSKMDLHRLEELLFECIRREERPILMMLTGNYDENQKLDRTLKSNYSLFFSTVTSTLLLSERESLYALSLLYNILKGKNFEELSPVEKRTFYWYNNILRSLIAEACYRLLRKYSSRTHEYSTTLKKTSELADTLRKGRGRQVGSGQAIVFYLNAAFPENIRVLIDTLQQFSSIREQLRRLLRALRLAGADIGDFETIEDELFKDISLLTKHPAISFLKHIEELYSKAENEVGIDQLDCIAKLLSRDMSNRMDIESFYHFIANSHSKISWLIGDLPEVSYALLSGALNKLDKIHEITVKFYSPAIKYRLYDLESLTYTLADLRKRLEEVINALSDRYDIDISKNKCIQDLMDNLKKLIDKINKLLNYYNKIEGLKTEEILTNDLSIQASLLRITLFDGLKFKSRRMVSEGILSTFISNIKNLDLSWLNNSVNEILGELRVIGEELSRDMPNKKELLNAIKDDLRGVATNTLSALCTRITSISENVKRISKLYEEYEDRIEELRRMAEEYISRISALVGG